jgi:hypothetical protein
MNSSALAMMITAFIAVIFMTSYYFIKVLRTPPRDPNKDSYLDTHE